jgi:hypothetical protein
LKGDKIKITAIDDVVVKEVGVVILGDENKLIEKGKAVQDEKNKLNWIYTSTASANTHHVKVIVDAADLPGHITEVVEEKEIS